MTLNQVGGALGALALVSLLVLHGCDRKSEPKAVPVPPAKVEKVTPAPKVTLTRPKRKVELPKSPAPAGVRYKRVLPGGKLDGSITCKFVRDFVAGKSKEELEALQKQYQVSGAQLAQYKQCLN